MSQAVPTGDPNWTRRSTSPEVVRALANTAAMGEIAIRRAANSAGGRALAAMVREYPLWSIFIASSIGYLLGGKRHPSPGYDYKPPSATGTRSPTPAKTRP